jgi:hypothetical protein
MIFSISMLPLLITMLPSTSVAPVWATKIQQISEAAERGYRPRQLVSADVNKVQIDQAAKVGYRTRELIAADPEVPRLVRPLSEGKALLYGLVDAALQRLGDAGEVLADVGSEEGQNLKKFRE